MSFRYNVSIHNLKIYGPGRIALSTSDDPCRNDFGVNVIDPHHIATCLTLMCVLPREPNCVESWHLSSCPQRPFPLVLGDLSINHVSSLALKRDVVRC